MVEVRITQFRPEGKRTKVRQLRPGQGLRIPGTVETPLETPGEIQRGNGTALSISVDEGGAYGVVHFQNGDLQSAVVPRQPHTSDISIKGRKTTVSW